VDINKIGGNYDFMSLASSQEKKVENLDKTFQNILDKKSMSKNDKLLWAKAKEFEAILIQSMLKEMRKTVEKNKMFHGGLGEDIFESMLDGKYATKIAKSSNFGLAKILFEQLKSKADK
jgi:flagellar protein FlgJ